MAMDKALKMKKVFWHIYLWKLRKIGEKEGEWSQATCEEEIQGNNGK